MELDRLEKAFLEGTVVDFGGYEYFVDPLADGIPRVEPERLKAAARELCKLAGDGFDIILAPEAMGIHLATAASILSGRPFTVARKRMYHLYGEVRADAHNGYSESSLFVNGITSSDRVLIIDDVIDTGSTAICLAEAVRSTGASLHGIVAVYDRSRRLKEISDSLGVPVRALMEVGVENGKPVVYKREGREIM